MSTAIFCFSDNGCMLARRLRRLLKLSDDSLIHTTEKFAEKYDFTPHKSVCADMGMLFSENDALIFICACGIAVRDIAPHIKSKTVDPAVICIDDRGQFVIPLLSGHIGGANALAKEIAEPLGATAVITTATDINGRFSCDEWAKTHDCEISSLKAAKDISAQILTGSVGISSEYPLPAALPSGLTAAGNGDYGIYVGVKTAMPYNTTLRLIPEIVTLGIGCRRGVEVNIIKSAVEKVFSQNEIDLRAVKKIASIDVKKDEAGLVGYAAKAGVPLEFYSAEQLAEVEGEFTESEFVKKTVGVGNVCERAAVLGGNRLIINKTACGGVTVAAGVSEWRITFE